MTGRLFAQLMGIDGYLKNDDDDFCQSVKFLSNLYRNFYFIFVNYHCELISLNFQFSRTISCEIRHLTIFYETKKKNDGHER